MKAQHSKFNGLMIRIFIQLKVNCLEKEAEEFGNEVNEDENNEYLWYSYIFFYFCPLDFIGKNLSIWFEKFPKVFLLSFKHLKFYWNEKNKTKIKYSVTKFSLLQYSKR
eukprot:snap_masked-scaffold_25-processed-gene-2.19-mRNA-1 protein AED:1.00 eAED:1.00 QI:0/0/0/0/1/1/5/0/108